MSNIIERKYAVQLTGIIERYKVKKLTPFLANGRCPSCLDSQSNKRKTRFYIIEKPDHFLCFCHNCPYSHKLSTFLSDFAPSLYQQYQLEVFQDKKAIEEVTNVISSTFPKQLQHKNKILKDLTKVSKLKQDHPVRKYLDSREIQTEQHFKLFYTPYFSKWVNAVSPAQALFEPKGLDPRLVLPLLDRKGNCFGVSARALKGQDPRYLTIRFTETYPKLYGLDLVNPNYNIFVVEGPLDSLFLDNSIAMCGTFLNGDQIADVTGCNKEKIIYVFDNEPRNKEMIKQMENVINQGYNIVIWPSHVKEKDINLMYQAGLDPKYLVNTNIWYGMAASLKLSEWKKIESN